MKRCLGIIEEKYSDIYQIPTQATVDSIILSCNGDIRCALNNLNFACLKGTADLPTIIKDNSTVQPSSKRKRNKKSTGTLKNMNKDECVGLLHGIGRVLYPKRVQTGDEWKFEHEPESIFNEFITQPSTFVNFLYENYIKFFSNFNDICQGADILSFSQLLLSKWRDDDLIAQYGLWYAITGLMVVNEKSLSKWNSVVGPKHIYIK